MIGTQIDFTCAMLNQKKPATKAGTLCAYTQRGTGKAEIQSGATDGQNKVATNLHLKMAQGIWE